MNEHTGQAWRGSAGAVWRIAHPPLYTSARRLSGDYRTAQQQRRVGRKLLYVNANFTSHMKQLHRHESDGLLQMFYAHLAKPENVVRFNWRTQLIAFWDNRRTQHYAINDYHSLRVMHQVTMCGERPS